MQLIFWASAAALLVLLLMMTTGRRFCASSKSLTALRKKIVSSNYCDSQSLETWEDTAYSIPSTTVQRPKLTPTRTVDVTMLSTIQSLGGLGIKYFMYRSVFDQCKYHECIDLYFEYGPLPSSVVGLK